MEHGTRFIKLEGKLDSETLYDSVYYVKATNYSGYAIKVRFPSTKDYLLKYPDGVKFFTGWLPLNRMNDTVFEITKIIPIQIEYVLREAITEDFKIIYDDEIKKIYGNFVLPSHKDGKAIYDKQKRASLFLIRNLLDLIKKRLLLVLE